MYTCILYAYTHAYIVSVCGFGLPILDGIGERWSMLDRKPEIGFTHTTHPHTDTHTHSLTHTHTHNHTVLYKELFVTTLGLPRS